MIDLSPWINSFIQALTATFSERVRFVGLQGSYARGEATEQSDIDVVVILDELTATDIQAYDALLQTLPHCESVCGFLSGKTELLRWEPSDLFQFYHDTKPLYGSLDELLPLIDKTAVERAIRIGVCNVYHGCVHNMLHDKSNEMLIGLYKSAIFTVQAICFQQTGKYISRHADLIACTSPEERAIVATFLALKNGAAVDFPLMSERLFSWCQKRINESK